MTGRLQPNPTFLARLERENLHTKPTAYELAYLPTWAVQCPLPVRDPALGTEPKVWQSFSGRSPNRLVARWLSCGVETQGREGPIGLPFGNNGRLALALLCRAIRKLPNLQAERKIALRLGGAECLRLAGKQPSGGSRSGVKVLREQFERLLLSVVFLDQPTAQGHRFEVQIPSVVTELGASRGDDILTAEILINPAFARSLQRAMPTDLRVLRAFGRNCLAMDLWHWLNYRCNTPEPLYIGWECLKAQFGQGGTARTAKNVWQRRVRQALVDIRALQPDLWVDCGREGVVIHPSESWVRRR